MVTLRDLRIKRTWRGSVGIVKDASGDESNANTTASMFISLQRAFRYLIIPTMQA